MHDVPIEPSRVEPVASWKQGPFWAGASIAALAVVALGVFAFRSRSTSAPVAPVVVAPHATDAPRAAEPVVLRIHVEPPTAVITLDGTVVGHGEAEITRARDGHRYQVALSAPGYVDASYVVVADADMRIDRVLQAIPSAPVATAPTQTASAHHTIAASTAPQPAPTEHHGPHIDRQNPF